MWVEQDFLTLHTQSRTFRDGNGKTFAVRRVGGGLFCALISV